MSVMTKTIPLSLQTAFADLIQRVDGAPTPGSVYAHERNGERFLNVKTRVGSTRLDLPIGAAGNPDVDAQARQYRLGMKLAQERRKVVTLLRNAGFPAPSRQMGAILDAVAAAGLFANGAVLVGTAAYLVSAPIVGEFLPAATVMTGDVDLATANIALSAAPPEAFLAILKRADPSFEAIMPLDPRKPSSRFRTEDRFLVDLLMPVQKREQPDPTPLPKLSAGATPLQYMAYLIQSPIRTIALHGSGVPVMVPQPARYAVHKLLVAQRRNPANRAKRSKDLMQAEVLIDALSRTDPFALEDAMEEARSRGKAGWSDLIDRSLTEIGRA